MKKNRIFCNGSEKPKHGNVQAESINGLKNVYGLQLALHLPEGSEIRRQTLVILKMKPDGRQLLNYSRVPNNHPPDC